jgi:hypothetical protein
VATVTVRRNAGACSACASVQKSTTNSQLAAAELCIVASTLASGVINVHSPTSYLINLIVLNKAFTIKLM